MRWVRVMKLFQSEGIKKYLPGIAWFFIVLILLMLPSKDLPDAEDWMARIFFDKWVHAGLFGGLVFFWLFPFGLTNHTAHNKRFFAAIIFIAVVLFGLLSEYLQMRFTADRQFDLGDWAADSVGAVLGLLFTSMVIESLKRQR